MPLGMEIDLGPGDFVLDGDPAPLLKKGAEPPPRFSAHVYCGQTAGWIKMALGTEMGLGPGHIVLDGNLSPLPKKGAGSPYAIGLLSCLSVCPVFLQRSRTVVKRLDGSRSNLACR